MPKSPLDTEPQRYAIEVAISMLGDAYAALFDKKKELELLEKTEDIEFSLVVLNLRLDALGKVETKLLEPLKEIYASAELVAQIPDHEERFSALKKQIETMKLIDSTFVDSIMQGL